MPDMKLPSGHPMDPVARQFESRIPGPEKQRSAVGAPTQPADANQQGEKTPSNARIGLPLSSESISAPAFFVDQRLAVCWIAGGGEDALSRALCGELAAVPARHAFELLTSGSVRAAVADWQAFFTFVYRVLKISTPATAFEMQIRQHGDAIPEDVLQQPDAPVKTSGNAFAVHSMPIVLADSGIDARSRLFGLRFPTGTLFVVRPEARDQRPAAPLDGEQAERQAASSTDPGSRSVGLLTAIVADARRLAETMLPDDFVDLMRSIFQETDDLCRPLGGRRVGTTGARAQYAFSQSAGRDPIFGAINCAMRLNAMIEQHRQKEGARGKWGLPPAFKIGISHAPNTPGDVADGSTSSLFIPGGPADQSYRLAAFAGANEIWITRDALICLPRRLLDQLAWGVDRDDGFQHRFFARLGDLKQAAGHDEPHPDVALLSAARIAEIKSSAPDRPVL